MWWISISVTSECVVVEEYCISVTSECVEMSVVVDVCVAQVGILVLSVSLFPQQQNVALKASLFPRSQSTLYCI